VNGAAASDGKRHGTSSVFWTLLSMLKLCLLKMVAGAGSEYLR
jgi:hypothetical protein